MTTYSYQNIDEKHYLVEDSKMESPSFEIGHFMPYNLMEYELNKKKEEYQNHLASLKRFPCDESFAGKKGLVEGEEFELYHYSDEMRINRVEAVPIPPVEGSQEELWE